MAERRKVGNYELLEKIGAGGMGAVFRARQVAMDRIVALKILPPSLAKKPTFIERFMREARASAKLNHPNIVNGIDVGNDSGLYYFAMEYIEGDSLKKIIEREERLSEKRTIEIVVAIAHALEHAHSHGILHRDIKPDNIIVDSRGTAKLCDLGLAHLAAEPDMETGPDNKRKAVGTPHYISPEQASGEDDLDATTDLYSLGATMYHMLTGVTMFQGSSSLKIMSKHVTEKPLAPSEFEVNLSKGMLSVLAKLLPKNRADRYTSAARLAQDLERIAEGHSPQYANLPADKWPFKGNLPAVDHPSIKKVATVSVEARPGKRVRSGGESSVGAYALGGVVLIGVLILAASTLTSDNPVREDRKKTPAHEAEVPPIKSDVLAVAVTSVPEKAEKVRAPEKQQPTAEKQPAIEKAPADPIGLADPAPLPVSSVASGNTDTAPVVEIAKPKTPLPVLLAEARKALEDGKYAQTQAALSTLRSDYANGDELKASLADITDLENRAKTALATSAMIDEGNVALISNGATVRNALQWQCMLDGKFENTKSTGFAYQPNPCEWIIVLGKTYLLREIRMLLLDVDNRFYQYTMEVSADDQTYTMVDDKSNSQARSWQFAAFAPTPVKYIRLKGKFNSAGPNFQIVEFEAYCHPTQRPASPRERPPEPTPVPVVSTPPPPATVPVVAETKKAEPEKVAHADKPKVNLLQLVKDKDSTNYNWDIEDNALVNRSTKGNKGGFNNKGKGNGQSSAMFDFPYVPPEEYDYTIEFSIEDPAPPNLGLVLQAVPMNQRSLVWVMPAAPDCFFGFDMISGLRYTETVNPTHRNIPKGVSISTLHKSTLQVRKDAVTVILDGNTLMIWRRDGANPTKDSQYRGKDSTALGVGAGNKVIIKVHAAEVVEITGTGEKR